MIEKKGSKFVVKSKDGSKNLSKPLTYDAALKRLGQVEAFKKRGNKK